MYRDCVVIHLFAPVLFPWAVLASLQNEGIVLQTKPSYGEIFFFFPPGATLVVTLPYTQAALPS